MIFPVLLNYLDITLRELEGRPDVKPSQTLDRIFYAFETFSQNLEEKLASHIPVNTRKTAKVITHVELNFRITNSTHFKYSESFPQIETAVQGSLPQNFFKHTDIHYSEINAIVIVSHILVSTGFNKTK